VEANYLQLHYHQVKEVSKKFNQQKQNLFSWFYFLSGDYLLKNFQQKDFKCLIPHSKKIFQPINSTIFKFDVNREKKLKFIILSNSLYCCSRY
jgi:hypothetical protein